MEHLSYSSITALKFGWKTFKENKKFWVIAVFLMIILSGPGGNFSFPKETPNSNFNNSPIERSLKLTHQTPNIPIVPAKVEEVLGAQTQLHQNNKVLIAILILAAIAFFLPLFVILILLSTSIDMGVIKLALMAIRGKEPRYETILSEVKLKKAFRFLCAEIFYALLIVLGAILFILPGIYFALKYCLVSYIIVDRNVGIKEAFRLSGESTKGHKTSLLALGFLFGLINILGALALLYGLLVTIPVSLLAVAYTYNHLSQQS